LNHTTDRRGLINDKIDSLILKINACDKKSKECSVQMLHGQKCQTRIAMCDSIVAAKLSIEKIKDPKMQR